MSKQTKKQAWHKWGAANQSADEAGGAEDAHFKKLSQRFWSFAQGAGFAGGEKTLADVLSDLWQARIYLALGALLAGVIALGFIGLAVPHTRATMIVAPADVMQAPDVSNAVGGSDAPMIQLLAQRIGGSMQSPGFVRFEHVYNGASVAGILLQDERVRQGLAQDRAFVFSAKNRGMDAARLADYIDRKVRLEPVKASSLRRMSYWHPDAAFARYFLARLHATADDLIRQAVVKDVGARTAYLQQAILEARNPEHRRSLTALLMEQERLLMLASTPQPYAASVVEPPAAFYKAEWPDAKLIFPIFMLVGAFLGFVMYGLRRVPK